MAWVGVPLTAESIVGAPRRLDEALVSEVARGGNVFDLYRPPLPPPAGKLACVIRMTELVGTPRTGVGGFDRIGVGRGVGGS